MYVCVCLVHVLYLIAFYDHSVCQLCTLTIVVLLCAYDTYYMSICPGR